MAPDTMKLADHLRILRAATCPEDVWPRSSAMGEVRAVYLAIAKSVHPDHHGDSPESREATALLNRWYAAAEKAFAAGTWGQRASATVIRADNEYTNLRPLARGELCDVYLADYPRAEAVLKIARNPRDRDLMATEAIVLRSLQAAPTQNGHHWRYLPALLESFQVPWGRTERPANAFLHLPGGYTLAAVVRRKGGALDARHVAWIWRRSLELLDWVHGQGWVHGGITPDHILVYPDNHGVKLLDWTTAVKDGGVVKVASGSWPGVVPPEVRRKDPASPATDLAAAAASMEWALGISKPPAPPFRGLLRACQLGSPARRHQSAREVYDLLTEQLRAAYGPPKFIPLEVP